MYKFLVVTIFITFAFNGSCQFFTNKTEELPLFPGCELVENSKKRSCTNDKLFEYILNNIVYPLEAKKQKVEGKAIISFVIEIDGCISTFKIHRDPGAGCGDAVISALKKMNADHLNWIPGKVNGKPVKVRYNLPFHFKL